ncbi:hypothetical protein UCDDS831_g02289 [Diplodia seriata]|uniref:Uncharacterized protein n=1 Tax=Diplodia seriata TaxID=420778 RepID=A0A0G2ER90_9PEZI|nr:hypothetical protein UCDDS831_g02289 [Diplodia seriata]
MPFWSRRRRGMRDIDIDIAIAARADPSLLAPYQSMLSSEFDPRPAPVTQRRPASARISQLYDDIVQQLNTMAAHRRSTRTSSDESDKADEARQGTTMSGRFGAARDRQLAAAQPKDLNRAGDAANVPQPTATNRPVGQQTIMSGVFGAAAGGASLRRCSGATELDRSAAFGQPVVNEHDYMEKTGPGSLASSVSSDGGVWIAGQAPRSPGERGYLRAAVRDMEDRFDNPSRGPEFVVMGRTIGSAVRIRFDDL